MKKPFNSYGSMCFLILALSAFLQPSIGRAANYYVAHDGQPQGDYTTWGNAASNIQAAVTAAGVGDTVWVRAGTYTNSGTYVVTIINSLTLRSETGVPEDVIINGGGVRRGIYVNLPIAAAGATVTIDGITITNGYTSTGTGGGGGIYINHSAIASGTATVQGCVIAGNFATNCYGGGLYTFGQINTAFNTVISHCRIMGNVRRSNTTNVGFGGGVAANRALLTVEYCDISENSDHGGSDHFGAHGSGGGIYIRDAAPGSVIRNCQIERNIADHTINPTFGDGGGIYRATSASDTNLLSIQNCVITSNTGYNGGGINAGYLSLENCRVQYNLGGSGGGLYTTGDAAARNCLITHNETTTVVGGWNHLKNPSVLSVDNCTITSNKTTGTSNPVGGLQAGVGTAWVIRNSIIYSNVAPSSVFRPNDYLPVSGAWSNSCSISKPIEIGGVVPPGPGNTLAYPNFVSAASGDFHLLTNSPCINTGTNQPWMATARDLDNEKRLDWESGLVDMGCYEYTPPPPAGTAVMIR